MYVFQFQLVKNVLFICSVFDRCWKKPSHSPWFIVAVVHRSYRRGAVLKKPLISDFSFPLGGPESDAGVYGSGCAYAYLCLLSHAVCGWGGPLAVGKARGLLWRSASVVTYYVPFALSLSSNITAHLFQLCSVNLWKSYSKMMSENPCMKRTACLYTEKIWYRNNFHSEIACKVHRSLQSNTELNVTFWNGVFLWNVFQKSIT